MEKRKFSVALTCDIEIDDDVIAAVDGEWRSRFYQLDTPEEVAAHIAFNILLHGARLSQLDGFADKKDEAVTLLHRSIDMQAEEVRPRRKGNRLRRSGVKSE